MALSALERGDPAQLGPFRLLGRLGAGGMGQVYLGRNPAGRLAAMKVVHPHLATDSQFRARFAREITTAARVRAPWTAAVVDADPDAALPWLATEYVTGAGLDQVVERTGPLAEADVMALAGRLADALAGLHASGVVHRDLKPSNVLLAADGPRLIDFGIAHAVDATKITHTGHVIGTPAYMSPEQALGSTTGPPSDVFSLASVLTFAATGSGPFGTVTSPVVMLLRVSDHEPDLSRLPARLRELIRPCFAKAPQDRPSSRELAVWLAPGPGAAPPALTLSPGARALLQESGDITDVTDALPVVGPRPDPEPAPPPAPRRRWLPIAGAVIAVAAVIAAVVLIGQPGGTASGPSTGASAAPSTASPTAPPGAAPPAAGSTPGQARQVASLQVGKGPEGVTPAPDGARAYVHNYTGRDVSVIDTAARTVAATIGVPGSPKGIAVTPDSKRIYILQLSGFVSVLDAATSAVVATIPIGKQPQGIEITPDGRFGYVPNRSDNTVSVIDTATNAVTATIPVGGAPESIAATPDSRSIWVFCYDAKAFSVIDTATSTVRATMPFEMAKGIAFTPDGARAYVIGNTIASPLSAIDVPGLKKLGEVGGLEGSPASVAVARSGRYAFVATADHKGVANAVRVVDTTSHFVVQVVPLDARPAGMGLSADGRTLYVASTDGNTAMIVDTAGFT